MPRPLFAYEFNYGFDEWKKAKEYAADTSEGLSTFEYYACNFWNLNPETGAKGESVLSPSKTFEINDDGKVIKITLIGIMTPETISTTSPLYFQDKNGKFIYGIDDATKDSDNEALYKTVQQNINEAQNSGSDLIIGVGHLGINESSLYNTATELLKHVHGFNAFIDGHSHHDSVNPIEGVPYIQTGTQFLNIGQLDIIKSAEGKYSVQTQLLRNDDYKGPYDETTKKIEVDWANKINIAYEEEVAFAPNYFYDNSVPESTERETRLVRKRETNLTDLCTDSFYWYASEIYGNCDASIFNGGAARACIKPGTVKFLDINKTVPFTNIVGVATMTGDTLREALEYASYYYGTDTEDSHLLHCCGVVFKIDTSKSCSVQVINNQWVGPPIDGNYRVCDLQIYNKQTNRYEDIDLNKTYTIAGSSYQFRYFGDGFNMFKRDDVKFHDFACFLDSVMREYCRNFVNDSNALPTLSSSNSPLKKYSGINIKYEDMYGANRMGAYTVKFDTDGGSYVSPQYVYAGWIPFSPNEKPQKENFEFDNWYADADHTTVFDFSQSINADTTVYANYKPSETPENPVANQENNTAQTSDDFGMIIVLIILSLVGSSLCIIRLRRS